MNLEQLIYDSGPVRRMGPFISDGAWLVRGDHPDAENHPAEDEMLKVIHGWRQGAPAVITPREDVTPWVECVTCYGTGVEMCPTCEHEDTCSDCGGRGGTGDKMALASVDIGDGREYFVQQRLLELLDGLELFVAGECWGVRGYPVIGGYRDGELVAALATVAP